MMVRAGVLFVCILTLFTGTFVFSQGGSVRIHVPRANVRAAPNDTGAVLTQVVGPLFLACWWLVLAMGGKGFGAEFRLLKLGRLLGALATVVVVLGLVFDAPLVQNLTALALMVFLLQGLAVFHAWAHVKRWHFGIVVLVYLLLITPLAMLGLSGVGLVDSWFDLRAPLRLQA